MQSASTIYDRLLINFQMTLEKFNGQNIDIACHFLESCGRYLFTVLQFGEDTASLDDFKRFNESLELMWRLKEKERVSSNQLANIEQAYYMCRPKYNNYNQ